MGIQKSLRDPLYVFAIVALIGVAIAAASMTLTSSESSADVEVVTTPEAPTATSAPMPTPTATVAPSYGDVLADTQRLLELAKVRDALGDYFAARGSYPSTSGVFSPLCEQPDDAGCQLKSVAPAVPAGFGDEPFWYRSDGRSYTLVARVAIAPAESNCPEEIPADLEGESVSCIEGGRQ
jgi:hypothetical protein